MEIAKGQFLQEENAVKKGSYLICDTSFLVLKIWSTVKYGNCHPFVLNHLKKQKAALFILCGTEIDWEFDPLRENPKNRDALYQIYKKELEAMNAYFIEVKGSKTERLNQSIKALTNH